MNNKGWGLSTLLVFLSIFGIFLLLVGILYNKNFSDIDTSEESYEEVEEVDSEYNYSDLESILKESAKEYITSKGIKSEYKLIITYDEIYNEGLIREFDDPKTSNQCMGYVIYENKELEPFIKCGDNYKTDEYDENLE